MMTRYFWYAIFVLGMTSQSRTKADPPLASSSISDMRIQDLKITATPTFRRRQP